MPELLNAGARLGRGPWRNGTRHREPSLMSTVRDQLDLGQLKPYKSLLIFEFRAARYRKSMLTDLTSGILTLIRGDRANKVLDEQEWTEAKSDLVAMYYQQRRQCAWTAQPGF